MRDRLIPNFRTTRFAEGYDIEAVDAFIDRVNEELSTLSGALTVKDIEDERFPAVRFEGGYSMDDVDDYLDNVAIPALRGARERAERRRAEERAAQLAEEPSGERRAEEPTGERSAEQRAEVRRESTRSVAAPVVATGASAQAPSHAVTCAAAIATEPVEATVASDQHIETPDLQAEFEKSAEQSVDEAEGVGPDGFELSSKPAGDELKGVGPSDDAGPVRLFGD